MTETSIGQRLREVRGTLTQAEFAERMGVAKITITRYEGDASVPDGNFLLKLENLFQVDPAWMLLGRALSNDSHINSEEAALLTDYKSISPSNKEIVRAMISVIANLEKRKA